jgi:ATP adenylyltransferase
VDTPVDKNPNAGTGDHDRPLFDSYFDMTHKLDYILKPKHYEKQTEETCVICKIIDRDESVQRFEVYRNKLFIIFLNLFPYTPGHIMISPLVHKTNFEEFSPQEVTEFGLLTQKTINVLKHFTRSDSYNLGWNQGPVAGGSMTHFHIHVVPRFKNELNFIEIIARSKPVVISLEDAEKFLRRYIPYFAGEKSIDEIFKSS